MEKIEQISFSLLLICLGLLALSLLFFGVRQYTSFEPLFIPPPDFDNHAVRLLSEVNDLESIKKMCATWANRYDLDNQLFNITLDKFEELLSGVTKGIILISTFFGCGFAYIYWKAKNLRNEQQNAL